MPFSKKAAPAAGLGAAQAPGGDKGGEAGGEKKNSDLLMRFFQSSFFDSFIALTYLYKSESQGVQDYLCNRLYTLPERDVERYLSQLTQLCIQRQGGSLERVIIDLCAQSLRIAVKTYWLLLAISQDLPKDTHVAAMRDACEQAALEGHWQLPFKQSKLPAPLSPAKRPSASGGASGQRTPPMLSPNGSFTQLQRPAWISVPGGGPGASPDPRMLTAGSGDGGSGYPMSPADPDSRPMSPDGLGGGMYSSVFMDTGVEGLIYGGTPPPDLRAIRQHVSSPRASQGQLLEGPGHPLLPLRMDMKRVSSLQQELGAGEGVSALLLRSSTAGEGGGPGVVQQSDGAEAGAAAGGGANGGAPLFSPPSSPRRRQTTFGATLDFVETLCQASSSLTAFQPEDRQWALRRALQQINVEIEKASRNGVAIWFPMGDSNLRVVRLAPRESRLLNSREKAPFTLCVEVLDEEEAEVAAEAREAAVAAVAAARGAAAAGGGRSSSGGKVSGQYADSAQSLLEQQQQQPLVQLMQPYVDGAAAAAAAEAAAHGIKFFANHHRTQSQDTSSSSMDAAALAAVQGSSATTGDAVAAAARGSTIDGSHSSSPRDSLRSGGSSGLQGDGQLASEPSLAGMLHTDTTTSPEAAANGHGSSRGDDASSGGQGGGGGSPARPRRLTDDLDAVSEVPSFSPGSSLLGSPPVLAAAEAAGEGDALLSSQTPSSVRFEPLPPPSQQQQSQQQHAQQHAQPPDHQLQRQLQALNLPQPHGGKLPGAGTWIGGAGSTSSSPVSAAAAAAAAAAEAHHSTGVSGAAGAGRRVTVTSSLETALAGLRGEAPLVSLRLEVLNDRPAEPAPSGSSGGGSGTGGSSITQPAAAHSSPRHAAAGGGGAGGAAVSSAERRRVSVEAASRAPPHQCDRSSWACKLGLCKLCNAKLATMDDEPWLQPHVRVHFTVQGGVDLSIRKTPAKHQRMPSHEAILKVAKQHKLPAPALPSPLSAPQQQVLLSPPLLGKQQPPQQQWQPPAPAAGSQQRPPAWQPAGASSSTGGSGVKPAAAPPAPAAAPAPAVAAVAAGLRGRSPDGGSKPGTDDDSLRQQAAAEAAYGEIWQSRKQRVQLASPHGRRPGWDLRCVIVKTGDDCRQELLAMQLIRVFHEIFAEAQLPLWLRPFEVLPTSSRTALIEMVPNAPSIHAVKAKSPPGTSLRDHLTAKFVAGSPAFLRSQRCFVESLAAYSLVCYLLQIKDRHNGNILLDDEGHLIHIDFGFMLSNSPGGVNFESAPFKLTRELLEVMDSNSEGKASELFDYFKVLMIQGFLAVRKHADRILLLVEMMQGSGCPCFKSRVAAVSGLKKRFNLALPEPQVVEVVLGLISDSLDAWRTRQYDYYQRVLNGIL